MKVRIILSKMKKHLIQGYIVFIVTAYLTAQSKGTMPSVSLTVEGGGSLVGQLCPGTMKMFCYGIDLSILRWRYNGNIDIVTVFSDASAPFSFEINNPAFLSVELLSVAQDPVDPNFGNFSSELVVNVSQLQAVSVMSITCGDPDTFKMIPVDVEIIQQTEPESPNGTNVTALYEFGSLTDVIVSWEQLEIRCPDFQTSLIYQVTLLGSGVVAVNPTSCGKVCMTSFQNFSGASVEYRVLLYAVNSIGTSEVVEYPTTIGPRLSLLVIVFLTLTILALILVAAFIIVDCVLKQLQKFVTRLFFCVASFLGLLSLVFLIVFLIITGVQQDTCSLDWRRTRNALIISAFLLACFGNMFLVCILLVSCVKKNSNMMDVHIDLLEHSPVLFHADPHRNDPADKQTGYQKEKSKHWWSSRPANRQETNELIDMRDESKVGTANSESSAFLINKGGHESTTQSKCTDSSGRLKFKRIKNSNPAVVVPGVLPATTLSRADQHLSNDAKPQTDEATYNSSETSNAPLSKAVQDKDAKQGRKYRFSLGPLKFGRSEDTTGAPVTSPVVPPGQTDLPDESSINRPKEETELVKPQTNEATYNGTETSNAPPLSKAVQDKDGKQEPKYRFSLGPLKFGKSGDTTPIGGAPPVVPPGQTYLPAGSNRPDEENGQTELVKPQTDEATYNSSETSNAPPFSEAMQDKDAKQEPKYRFSLGPLKFGRSEDTTPINCAPVTSPVVTLGQTDLPAGNSINRPDEKNGQTEVVKPQTDETTYNSSETGNAPPFSEAVQDKDAKQEPKYRFSLGPLKFGRSEDTTPIGCAPVTSPVVTPGQTDLPAGNSINRPDEKNGQTEVVKPQTDEATYNSSETSNAPPFSEAVQDKDSKQEPKYRFSLGPLKFGRSEDTTPIGCAPVTSPVVTPGQTDLPAGNSINRPDEKNGQTEVVKPQTDEATYNSSETSNAPPFSEAVQDKDSKQEPKYRFSLGPLKFGRSEDTTPIDCAPVTSPVVTLGQTDLPAGNSINRPDEKNGQTEVVKPQTDEATYNSSETGNAPPFSEAVQDKDAKQEPKYRFSLGPLKFGRSEDTTPIGCAPVTSPVVTPGQTDLPAGNSINRPDEKNRQTEVVKPQTDEATYSSSETGNAPPFSEAMQDKDAKQEPKYRFSLGPLKFGRSEDTTPIDCAPVTSPVVTLGQTDLPAGNSINRPDEKNGQTEVVKPQTDEATYNSSETSNAPPFSEAVQDKDAKQEPKYRFSLGPLKFGRSEDTTPIGCAPVTSPVVTPGQTDLSAGSSANRPKEENVHTEFVKPQTTYNTSDATPLSVAVMQDKDAKQEPKYRYSLGPLKFGRSKDTTPIGCAPVTSPVVPPGQTDLPAGSSANRLDEENGQTELVKLQTDEATCTTPVSGAPVTSPIVPPGQTDLPADVNDDSFEIITLPGTVQDLVMDLHN
ncbi:uncharacterized protein LOC135351061 isoform X3 [Halichondria panicea]|uniref:uncharacterized protein LOC135351061 isoform X3 n=1 Tax=Halichondria panicea TaxID=6063 RepID=UPI00312B7425